MSRVFKVDYIPDPDRGRPLWNAKIFVGVANQDPTIPSNQIQLTGDIGFPVGQSIPVPQPVRTNAGGITVYNNSPLDLNAPGQEYAIQIFDRNDNLIYNFPQVDGSVVMNTTSQEEVTGLTIWPEVGEAVIGQTIPAGTDAIRYPFNGRSTLFTIKPPVAVTGTITNITINSSGIGELEVDNSDVYDLAEFNSFIAANDGDSQLVGGSIWPLSSQKNTQVSDEIPEGTSAVRIDGKTLFLDAFESGEVTSLDPLVIGGVTVQTFRNLFMDSVAQAESYSDYYIGDTVRVWDFYGKDDPNGSGEIKFKVVPGGTGAPDGASFIDVGSLQLAQVFEYGIPTLKKFGGRAEGDSGFDNFDRLTAAFAFGATVYIDNDRFGYLIGDSIDLTHRLQGAALICPAYASTSTQQTKIFGNTGEFAMFDTTGSQSVKFDGIQLLSATGNSNPSKLGILQARSTDPGFQFAQFHSYTNVTVDIAADDTAFGGFGSIGVYNRASEICTYRDLVSLANNGVVITNTAVAGVTSKYVTIGGPTSTSDINFAGTCSLTSKGGIGNALYTVGAQAIKGQVYLNGNTGRTPGTVEACGSAMFGISGEHDLTTFVEFSPHLMYIDATMKNSKISFIATVSADRYILCDSGFTSIDDTKFDVKNPISGAVTAPQVFIENDSAASTRGVTIELPYDPASGDFTNNTNPQFNRINCKFKGRTIEDYTGVIGRFNEVVITDSTTRVGPSIITGTGNPNGVVDGRPATFYMQSNGDWYQKTTAAGILTGWVLK